MAISFLHSSMDIVAVYEIVLVSALYTYVCPPHAFHRCDTPVGSMATLTLLFNLWLLVLLASGLLRGPLDRGLWQVIRGKTKVAIHILDGS